MTSTSETAEVGGAVTWGLVAAWALHDAEELATVAAWVRRNAPVLRERYPAVPEAVWRRVESVDRREFAVAVALVGLYVVAAGAAGRASGGSSAFYQSVLYGFGLHGLVHMGQAAALRRYTPGSVTSPLVVVPFTLWARGRLRRAGVSRPTRPRDLVIALGGAGAVALAAHAVAQSLPGAGDRP
ncbi:HXXEE domain-containing protein [Streptomyces tagetis]|uniref:HXXEE domain-containing protein n=1 Tax=Streptomyces tagetis TaxID=2820809 RepID=A0A941BAR5_9ACTN|nr:HXXEE domain-containing protein [Streptomyces sp. RG38]MBQ0830893.1 HXXEE domain-containing protein [Streptomyces sp. RG38]